uniref:Uncharacterized protein n=1 Tax=Cucumis melo TaxID=3656 RepID=A0A9I9DWX1_CUCME
MEALEQNAEKNSFKQKLVEWLKDNNLKLAPSDADVNNALVDEDMDLYDMGNHVSPSKLLVGTLEG